MKNRLILLIAVSILAGMVSGCVKVSVEPLSEKIGAPSEGMSSWDYGRLIRLDPQNTMKANFSAAKGMGGYFLINNQGEPTISVVDYDIGAVSYTHLRAHET